MNNSSAHDDSGIIERCIIRDVAAWSALVEKYSTLIKDAIRNRARKYGADLACHDIEDIAQNVLTAIWKDGKLSGVKNRKNISCWLAVVSGNAAVEYLRTRGDIEPIDEERVPYPETGHTEEALSEIEKAIEELPPKENLIMQLLLFHDKKHREIADMLDMPGGTVSSHIKRAKTKLRKSLKL